MRSMAQTLRFGSFTAPQPSRVSSGKARIEQSSSSRSVETPSFSYGEETEPTRSGVGYPQLPYLKAPRYTRFVKLTAKVKLQPTPEQRAVLLETMRRFNAACDYISGVGWESKKFRQFDLHKLTYYAVKNEFDLAAQMTVRAVAKVADAYKLDKQTKRSFRELGAITYDDRVLSWKLTASTVSIWTLQGRQTIPFVCGDYQRRLLATQQGETDLAYVRGEFYLLTTVNVEEPEPVEVEGVLGVDLGIVQIATDSDGERHSGSHLNQVRHRHRRLRKKLQKKGTKGAKRRLKKLSGKEARFTNHTNHVLTKKLVEKAKRTRRAIALEQLKGIRGRARVRKPMRATLHSWSFFDFGEKLSYKCKRAGVPLFFVDPRYTSQECSLCGHIERGNRPSQSVFCCKSCGHTANADTNAARNISRRGLVNVPYLGEASCVSLHGSVPGSPRL